jgi:signal transduction histidine kinase
MLLQLGACAVLAGGVVLVLKSYSREQAVAAEELLRHVIAHTAIDALIQRDAMQLVSYLNYLKGQYPALSYARISWTKGQKVSHYTLGTSVADSHIKELRVRVFDPNQPDRAAEVVFGADQRVFRVTLAQSRRRLMKIIVGVSFLASLVGLLASWLFAYTLTTPLARLTSLAESIGQGRLGVRLDMDSTDEVGQLARAFNTMSERLEESEEIRRDFASSVTMLRPIDIVPIVQDVCLFFEEKARLQEVTLKAVAGPLPAVQGDPKRVRQMLVNLVSNALKFSRPGGRIDISAKQLRESDARFLEISVIDDGCGRVAAVSSPGKGTKVLLTLPLAF